MGGNIPGGNFLGGNFLGGNFPGGVWWVGIFPEGISLEPFKTETDIYFTWINFLLKKLCCQILIELFMYFAWIVNNVIVHILLINHLNLIK